MSFTVYAKALQRAAQILGGKDRLRAYLRVSMRELDAWLEAAQKPPVDVFLKAVDLISAMPAPENPGRVSDTVQESRRLRRESGVIRQRTLQIRQSILAGEPTRGAKRKALSVLSFLEAKFEPAQGREMVEAALDTALGATGAPKGNVQLVCPEGLRIVAQRGFDQPFLDFFACVEDGGSACGAAMKQGKRVVVPDVAASPIFAGTAAGKAMAQADARAVQCTPLFASSGWVLGVLSTHYGEPHQPSERELEMIDRIAARTAFWLEGGSA